MSVELDADGRGKCANCGRHVSSAFGRVHGDEDDIAHRCLGCDCARRIMRGSAAGVDVDMPDPDEERYQNRNRGQRVAAPVAVTE